MNDIISRISIIIEISSSISRISNIIEISSSIIVQSAELV